MDKRFSILAVDDEPINIQLMTAALKNDYDIHTALSGLDAIELLEEHIPDLILLDVMMPDVSGYDVCKSIKADERFIDIPIIFLTSLDSHDGELQGLELGGIDYLTKPTNFDLLKLRIRNHIVQKARNDLMREQLVQLARQKEELAEMLADKDKQNIQHYKDEEEKQALEKLFQQAQKLESLGVLAGGIAHDFNNILAIIIGYCSLVKMDYETAEEFIPGIEKAAERAAALCRQMLAYAGKATISQSQVDMTVLVDEMVKMLKATISRNVVITTSLSSDIPRITGDVSQLRQVAMNLIINASEAIGTEQGVIFVSLTRSEIKAGQAEKDYNGVTIPAGQYICLEVTDSGCGMSGETRQRIFEPFYTTKFTGRGLGMSALLGIIRSHKGVLQFESQLGQGTTFKVYLPAQISIAEEDLLQQAAQEPWKGSGAILLVEDEEQVLLIAGTMLKALGFSVIEAANGLEALELYRKNAADITLVVTDMGMPVMDGYTLFNELKKLDPELPIIVSSGFGDADVTSRIPREEIAGLANKPYSFDQLRVVLRGVVEGT
jgi:CheY-like chemotaxis protein